jgi:hypothetical protein
MNRSSRLRARAGLGLLLVDEAHEAVPVQLFEQRPRRLEEARLRRRRVAELLAAAADREAHEVGEQEAEAAVVVGRHPLALAFLFVELEQQGEEQALVAAPQVEQRALRRAHRLVVVPFFDQAGALAVHVQAPAEVIFEELPECRLVAPQEEEEIRIVVAIEESGLGEHVQYSANALAAAPVEGEAGKPGSAPAGIGSRLGRALRIVNHRRFSERRGRRRDRVRRAARPRARSGRGRRELRRSPPAPRGKTGSPWRGRRGDRAP